MIVNDNNVKIWASLIAPNPDDVSYWVDLTADPHGNIIKFFDEGTEQWLNLTSPTSDYAVYPYIGPNGNWFIENKDSGISASGEIPDATINGYLIANNPVLTKGDIGLGNVANLAPEDYPVPDAVYGLIDGKVDETRTINGHSLATDVTITKGDIGLGSVENIAPADMPISTATATALSGKADATRSIIAGAGLTGGGNLTADRTINIASATDGITVNADSIQLNTNNTLISTSTTQPLSAAQGKVLNDKNVEQDAALLERPIMIDPTGDTITPSLGAYSKDEADALFVAKTQVVQTEGTSTTNVMSQKAVTDELTALETDLNVTTDKITELDIQINGEINRSIEEYHVLSSYKRVSLSKTIPSGYIIYGVDLKSNIVYLGQNTAELKLNDLVFPYTTTKEYTGLFSSSEGIISIESGNGKENVDGLVKDVKNIKEVSAELEGSTIFQEKKIQDLNDSLSSIEVDECDISHMFVSKINGFVGTGGKIINHNAYLLALYRLKKGYTYTFTNKSAGVNNWKSVVKIDSPEQFVVDGLVGDTLLYCGEGGTADYIPEKDEYVILQGGSNSYIVYPSQTYASIIRTFKVREDNFSILNKKVSFLFENSLSLTKKCLNNNYISQLDRYVLDRSLMSLQPLSGSGYFANLYKLQKGHSYFFERAIDNELFSVAQFDEPEMFKPNGAFLRPILDRAMRTVFTPVEDTYVTIIGNQSYYTTEKISADIYELYYSSNEQEAVCVVPDDLYAVVGHEFNLYYDTIVKSLDKGLASPFGYYVEIQCPTIGLVDSNNCIRYDRHWHIDGNHLTENFVGIHDVYVKVFDAKLKLVYEKVAKLHVRLNGQFNTKKNILVIGDSWVANGNIVRTLYEDFENEGGVMPTFIGTTGTSPFNHEGYGGYQFETFVKPNKQYMFYVPKSVIVSASDIYTDANGCKYRVDKVLSETEDTKSLTCTDFENKSILNSGDSGVLTKNSGSSASTQQVTYSNVIIQSNPFYNLQTEELDFNNYMTRFEGKLDAVVIQLGFNDAVYSVPLGITDYVVKNAKTLVDAIIAFNNDVKVILQIPGLATSAISGFQVGRDTTLSQWIDRINNVWLVRLALIEEFSKESYKQNVYIGQAVLGMDRFYGFNTTAVKSSDRISQQDILHTNGSHPSVDGYAQIADGYFLQLVNIINS